MANVEKLNIGIDTYDLRDASAVHTVDSTMSSSSTSPVQNKVVKEYVDDAIQNEPYIHIVIGLGVMVFFENFTTSPTSYSGLIADADFKMALARPVVVDYGSYGTTIIQGLILNMDSIPASNHWQFRFPDAVVFNGTLTNGLEGDLTYAEGDGWYLDNLEVCTPEFKNYTDEAITNLSILSTQVEANATEAATPANGDGLIFADSDDANKLKRMTNGFGTSTTTFLRNDGTWAAPPSSEAPVSRIFHGTCSTAAGTTAKVVTCPQFLASDFVTGAIVFVTFTATNSGAVGSITLNVNGTGAKNIKYMRNAAESNLPSTGYLRANMTYRFVYNGTYWVCDTDYDADTVTMLTYRTFRVASDAGGSLYSYKLCALDNNGDLIPFNFVSSSPTTAYTKAITTHSFNPFRGFLYYSGTTTTSAGSGRDANEFRSAVQFDCTYSMNINSKGTAGSTALTAYDPVYVKALYTASTRLAKLVADTSNSNYLVRSSVVQALPSADPNTGLADGTFYIYILLGQAYSKYQIDMFDNKIVYYWNTKAGMMTEFTGIIEADYATPADISTAINALDASASGLSASKTITALSETNGVISASASDIAIDGSQVASGTIAEARLPSTAVKKSDELQTTNPFAPPSLKGPYISKIDNAFYAAPKRWTVTSTPTGSVDPLFNGDYESQRVIAAGTSCTFNMKFDTEPNGYFPGYPYGNILVSFYNSSAPASVTGRVYCNYESHGVGWHDINFSIVSGGSTSQVVYTGRNAVYAISEIEITVTAPASASAGITQIEMHLDRPNNARSPFLSKYAAETLYYGLTAPSFTGSLRGELNYGICATAAATAAKVVTCAGFVLTTGARISVRFTNGSSSTSTMTLNVNGTGAKNCGVYIYNGNWQVLTNRCDKGEVLEFMYDGTYWIVLTPYTLRNFGTCDARLTSANRSFANYGLEYFLATSSMTTGKPPVDAAILGMHWDNGNIWGHQLAVGNGTGRVFTRAQNGTTTWSDWLELPRLSSAPSNGDIIVSDDTTGVGLIKGVSSLASTSITSDATESAAIGTGDGLIFADSDDSNKLKRMTSGFDVSNNTSFLRQDGVWAVPAGGSGGTSGIFKGTCATGAAGDPKVVQCPEFTSEDLVKGAVIFVTFTYTNSASVNSVQMNVNGTGAKRIMQLKNTVLGTMTTNGELVANQTYMFTYDGTYWVLSNDDDRTNVAALGNGHKNIGTTNRYQFLVSAPKDDTNTADHKRALFAINAVDTGSTVYTKAFRTWSFDPFGVFAYWNSADRVSSEGTFGDPTRLQIEGSVSGNYGFNLKQNGTAGTQGLVDNKAVYMKSKYDFATQTATLWQDTASANYLNRSGLVQELPTTNPNTSTDTYVYIYLGQAYGGDARTFYLLPYHPVYMWNEAKGRMDLFTGGPMEGSGTCTISDGSGTSFTANYYKVGQQVTVSGTIPNVGSTATALVGLPFAPIDNVQTTLTWTDSSLMSMVVARLSISSGSKNITPMGYAKVGVSSTSNAGSWLSQVPSGGVPFNITYVTDVP